MRLTRVFQSLLCILPAIMVSTLLFVLLSACESKDSNQAHTEINQPADSIPETPGATLEPASTDRDEPAPEIESVLMDGSEFRLSDLRGQVVVLNFWATWCAPCRVEIPDLVDLQEEYGDGGLHIVGISLDVEGFEVVHPFSEEFGINYDMMVDDGSIAEDLGGIFGLPTSIIIDKKGHIRQFIPGIVTRDLILPMIESLMAE